MKYRMLALFFCVFSISGLVAQSEGARQAGSRGQGREMDPARQVERLAKSLDLNDTQQAELLAYFEATGEAMRGEMAEAESREDRQAIMQEYRQLHDEKMAALLTPEQLEKYQKIMARREARRQERGPRQGRSERRRTSETPPSGTGGF